MKEIVVLSMKHANIKQQTENSKPSAANGPWECWGLRQPLSELTSDRRNVCWVYVEAKRRRYHVGEDLCFAYSLQLPNRPTAKKNVNYDRNWSILVTKIYQWPYSRIELNKVGRSAKSRLVSLEQNLVQLSDSHSTIYAGVTSLEQAQIQITWEIFFPWL